jgi:hypothetical protein
VALVCPDTQEPNVGSPADRRRQSSCEPRTGGQAQPRGARGRCPDHRSAWSGACAKDIGRWHASRTTTRG